MVLQHYATFYKIKNKYARVVKKKKKKVKVKDPCDLVAIFMCKYYTIGIQKPQSLFGISRSTRSTAYFISMNIISAFET